MCHWEPRVKGLWCHDVRCGSFFKFAPSQSMCYASMNVATGTCSPSWPYEHTVSAEIDSKEPQVHVGQNNSLLLGLTGSQARPARFHMSHLSLSPADGHLGPLVQRGNRGPSTHCTRILGLKKPSPQVCRLLWMSPDGAVTLISSHLSKWSSKVSDQGSFPESPASRDGPLARGCDLAVSECGSRCFGRREINSWPFKAW